MQCREREYLWKEFHFRSAVISTLKTLHLGLRPTFFSFLTKLVTVCGVGLGDLGVVGSDDIGRGHKVQKWGTEDWFN